MTDPAVILLVEDDPASLAPLVQALTPAGFHIHPVSSGDAALAAVAVRTPDLILLSLHIQDHDGLEVCRRLKADEATRQIPVILIASASDVEARVAALRLGAADCITAPFHFEELLARVSTSVALARAERALSASEARSHRLFEANPNPMYLFDDATLRFLDVNDAAIAHYGYSRAEWLTMALEDIRPKEDVERLHAVLAPAREPLNRFGLWRHITKDGSLIEVEIIAHSLEHRGRAATMVMALDVTERRAAEQSLRASEARYRALAESANLAIVTTDPQGRIVNWNRGAEAMFGFGEAEMLGEPLSRLMPHRYREPHLLELQWVQAVASPRAAGSSVELMGRRKDGGEFPLELSLARWEVAEGWFITAIMMDISGRRQVEASLVLQSAALSAAANAIVITDRDGVMVWVNPAFSSLTGYGPDEAIGKNPRDLLKSGKQDPAFYKVLWDTVLAGKVWQGELLNRRKDGSEYPEEQTITPVKDPDGAITHFIGIKRDLTAEKGLQSQLIQAQKMEAIGRLTGGIAHDFNNILMAILGYSDFLVDELRSQPHLLEDAREIRKAADRAATLTRQLLAFSRKQLLVPRALDLNAVIVDLEKLLRRLLGEDIQLRTILAPDLGTVYADPGQIEQVIMNLAVNARDAMPSGGPLEIRTSNADLDATYTRERRYVTPGPYVALWVTDRGTGIPKDVLPRLFEPYFTTKELGKGTGLGLATVFGIVKQSGGNIEVYSELDIGTTFKVYLPRRAEAATIREVTAVPEVTGGDETILIVDDDTTIGSLVERILMQRGYRVLCAAGPSEAMEIARADPGTIDLLVTDVVMPEQGGKELATTLAGLRPGIKVLYMSGFTGDPIAHRGLIERGEPILTKPVSANTLLRAVREVLEGRPNVGA